MPWLQSPSAVTRDLRGGGGALTPASLAGPALASCTRPPLAASPPRSLPEQQPAGGGGAGRRGPRPGGRPSSSRGRRGQTDSREGPSREAPPRHCPPPPRAGLARNGTSRSRGPASRRVAEGRGWGRAGLAAPCQVTCRGRAQSAASARPGSRWGRGSRSPCRRSRSRWCRCCAAGRRWPPAGSCSALGGSSCWCCWASSSTSTRRSSSKTSRPRRRTSRGRGRRRSTSSTTRSATTASSRPASTFSWGSSPSAKCGSTSGRSTWSAEDASPAPPHRWLLPPLQFSLSYLFCWALTLARDSIWVLSHPSALSSPWISFCPLHL